MIKIGILGGGQLGKMLCLEAAKWGWHTSILDADADMPAAAVCGTFVKGDFRNFEDVVAFGKGKDVLTIEIEHVNVDALEHLQGHHGVRVHPDPQALRVIKDKGLQKQYLRKHRIPTSDFVLVRDRQAAEKELARGRMSYPFVQKSRTEGYDGKGVQIIRNADEMRSKWLLVPSIMEELVPIKTEIAVIAARNERGEVACFEAVEMGFHPEANLVEWLVCPPTSVPKPILRKAEKLAEKVIKAFDVCGLLAIEMFVTIDNQLLINEVAPRPHNSGHHTMESAFTCQFQQHLRGIGNLPLGSTRQLMPSVLHNVLGEEGFFGAVSYEGMEECLAMEGVFVHIYGKQSTKPFRKMGHINICDKSAAKAMEKALQVKELFKART